MPITTVKRSYECKLYYSARGNSVAAPRSVTTISGSPIITLVSTADIVVGQTITGTGIPASSTVVSIVADTSITINHNATASGTVTGTFGVPWVEVAGVEDVTGEETFDSDDINIRQMAGVKCVEPILQGQSVEFEMPFDEDDDQRLFFVDAATNRTAIGIAIMSGDIGTSTSQGPQFDAKVFDMSRSEPIGKLVRQKFKLMPCLSANAATYVNPS